MKQAEIRNVFLILATTTILSGCVGGGDGGGLFGAKSDGSEPAAQATSTRIVDRDVEAPEVFQTTDQALWDGRPSLGGVWVASPDTKDPERVIIRNKANGKFVIGALFRRENLNPGPKLQISSDAAAALGILAGAPTQINVTALRRDQAEVAPDATKPILDSTESVATAAIDPIAKAGAAIDRAEAKKAPDPIAPTVTSAPLDAPVAAAKPAAAPVAKAPAAPNVSGGLTIQIGIFSVEANAKRAADALKKAGMAADVRKEESKGKSLWSVTTKGDASALTKVKGLGFPDAYFLKR